VRFITLAASLLLVPILAGDEQGASKIEIVSPLPYGEKGYYEISRPGFVYRGRYQSLAGVDVKNFVIHSFEGKRHLICGKLKAGYWESHDDLALNSLRFVNSYFLPSSDPKSEFLLVILEYYGVGGSSDSSGIAQVWKLRDSALSIQQQIDYNTHFGGAETYQKFSPEDHQFAVRSSHYLPGDAHCCISAYDELTFRWTGAEYQLARIETKRLSSPSGTGSLSKKVN